MFYVYVLQSAEGKFYIGSTEDISKRIAQHNSKRYNCWTKRYNDWRLCYSEEYKTRTEALIRERQIKNMKGGRGFHQLLNQQVARWAYNPAVADFGGIVGSNPAPATNK